MIKSIKEVSLERIDTKIEIDKTWDDSSMVKSLSGTDKIIEIDLGDSSKIFINHKREVIPENDYFLSYTTLDPKNGIEEPVVPEIKYKEIDFAYSIICKKPVTYGKLINNAIHQEFSEENGEIEAINRKRFTDPDDPEIKIHDDFVLWVKTGLREIGWNNGN